MADPRRLFLALQPDAAAAAAPSAVAVPAGARAVHPDDLHLTLAFLGDLTPSAQLLAIDAARSVAQGPVSAHLASVEVWAAPRALCAVAAAGEEPVAAFAARLHAALAARGFPPPDHPFRTHVTLARHLPRNVVPPLPLPEPVAWLARELVLMDSVEGGLPRYRVVATVRLEG